uniref:Uncharacterized protein n=1 Tax=viral metagenome TaxID=1070528 RepID=A0A6C0B6H9_9ZZZZ
MKEKRIIKLYNELHLGDQLFNVIFFNINKNYIEENNIFIEYYCGKQYHQQVSEFNLSKNVSILEYIPGNDSGFNLWIGSTEFEVNWYNKKTEYMDVFLVNFYNEFLKKQNLPISFEKLEYKDPDIQRRYEDLDIKYNSKYSNLDFLIINSTPLSNQYVKDITKWNNFITKMNLKYNIVTSEKVNGVKCTCDDKLTVKDIQSISAHSKKIIVISSGVIPALFNTDTLNNVETIYSFSHVDKYSHPKFVNKEDIDELYVLINNEESFQNMELFSNDSSLFIFLIFLLVCSLYYNNNILNYYYRLKKYIVRPVKRKI